MRIDPRAAAAPGGTPAPSTRRTRSRAPVHPTLGYIPVAIPPGSVRLGPLERGDQGISSASESRNETRVRKSLLKAPGVQWVVTYRHDTGLYEIVGRTGTLRFERLRAPDGRLLFRIHSIDGKNPVPGTDGRAHSTLAEEIRDAGGPGKPVRRELAHYPDLLRKLAQVFDDEHSPDLVYVPWPDSDPNHPGTGSHGVPDATQSRAPLVMAGPGIPAGRVVDIGVRNVDVAPTIAEFLGIRPLLGRTGSGAVRRQLLKWQDGDSFASAIADARLGARRYGSARRAVLFMLDGAGQAILQDELARGNLPNIARIYRAGTALRYGSLADYPTVTWANHNSTATGASPGHSGILNNSWYIRGERRERLITDGGKLNSFFTGRSMDPKVETLYEAVARTFGDREITAALNQPAGRGATVSTLDLAGIGHLLRNAVGIARRYLDGARMVDPQRKASATEWSTASWQDNLAASIGATLLAGRRKPKFTMFEFTLPDNQAHHYGPQSENARAALQEADRSVGRVLHELERDGALPETLIALSADHGLEHQSTDKSQLGGWFKALKASGVKTVESTRFVYLRTMEYSVHGPTPRAGTPSRLAVRVVDDDENTRGFQPAVEGAVVTLTDASGKTWTATTDASGVAHLDVQPGEAGNLSLKIARKGLTTERGTIRVERDSSQTADVPAAGPQVRPLRRRLV